MGCSAVHSVGISIIRCCLSQRRARTQSLQIKPAHAAGVENASNRCPTDTCRMHLASQAWKLLLVQARQEFPAETGLYLQALDGIRTRDLLITDETLYLLSYESGFELFFSCSPESYYPGQRRCAFRSFFVLLSQKPLHRPRPTR